MQAGILVRWLRSVMVLLWVLLPARAWSQDTPAQAPEPAPSAESAAQPAPPTEPAPRAEAAPGEVPAPPTEPAPPAEAAAEEVAPVEEPAAEEAPPQEPPSASASGTAELHIVQRSYATGMSSIVAITGSQLDDPIVVQVLRGESPVGGQRVDFLIVDQPSGAEGAALSADHAFTDAEGLARVELSVGDAEGQYLVSAVHAEGVGRAEPVQTRVDAMSPAWVMFLVFGLLGGLGLFLFGMNLASDNLQRAFGTQMRTLIGKLTRNRVSAVLVGTVASGVLQSSSAATVMLVGFVSAGMMTLTQAIAVTMGTKVGVTITVQVIAFDVSRYSLAVVGLGCRAGK